MPGAADMGITEAMVRGGVEALVGLDQPDARGEEDYPGAQIAAEEILVGFGGLWPAADLLAADLAEGLVKGGRVRCCAGGNDLVKQPRRPVWVDLTCVDLVQQVEQVYGVGRVRADAP